MAELRYSLFLLFFITNYSQAMQNEKVVIKNKMKLIKNFPYYLKMQKDVSKNINLELINLGKVL